jgi:Arc/MetJ-type ribon-helix-helix transcriptional regulator
MANTKKYNTARMFVNLSSDDRKFLDMYSKKTFRSLSDTIRYAISFLKQIEGWKALPRVESEPKEEKI